MQNPLAKLCALNPWYMPTHPPGPHALLSLFFLISQVLFSQTHLQMVAGFPHKHSLISNTSKMPNINFGGLRHLETKVKTHSDHVHISVKSWILLFACKNQEKGRQGTEGKTPLTTCHVQLLDNDTAIYVRLRNTWWQHLITSRMYWGNCSNNT